ncbi:carbohydrate ABC transporter permease [Lacisediminihabitans profunda]|uniref:Sugar ABC transporter permease n=1 Tax=Lacisediminihabitans profunda TaxID=2594790 RepID=A0A5C8UQR1_9MICO|nr:sugar ABC transporter permease [Lacisediminihabitans profunda]TXN29787.1 sugar ABC transporter permease [Lacisediminihabitans profunda]
MLVALYLSFTDTNLSNAVGAPVHNVGLNNYASVLTSTDFSSAVSTTCWIIIPAVVIEMVLGVGIALWLNRPRRYARGMRAVTLLPYLLVPVVIGNFFRMFYSAQFGQLNYYLSLVGLPAHAWLTDPATVRWAVVALEVWHTTPFVALLCLAGLAGMSPDPLEASMVDGANAWQRFVHIVLPDLLPILGAVLVLRAMDAIQLFDEVYVLTGGGPGRLTSVINLYLYQFGFRQFQIGQTSAAVTVIVVFLAALALIAFSIMRSRSRSRERNSGLG